MSTMTNNLAATITTVRRELDAFDKAYKDTAFSQDSHTLAFRRLVAEAMGYYMEEEAVIAKDDSGDLIGFAVFTESHWQEPRLHVMHINTKASRTLGIGIGSLVLSKLTDIAISRRVDVITVHSEPGARGYYEKMGFYEYQPYDFAYGLTVGKDVLEGLAG